MSGLQTSIRQIAAPHLPIDALERASRPAGNVKTKTLSLMAVTTPTIRTAGQRGVAVRLFAHQGCQREAQVSLPIRLILVGDEDTHRRCLYDVLRGQGYVTQGFRTATQALAAIKPGTFDLLLAELTTSDTDAAALARAAREIDPYLGAIVMVGGGAHATNGDVLHDDAIEYIAGSCDSDTILAIVSHALTLQRLRRSNALLQETERRHRAELAAANEALDSLTRSMSHDLRAPLRAIDSLIQILSEDHLETLAAEGQSVLAVIRDGCRQMDGLITDLLSFCQVSRQPLELEPLNMTALAHEAAAQAKADYASRLPSLDISSLPPCVGDALLIRQVWCQLLDNALKYSSKRASPTVRVSGRIDGREVIYQVDDNGVGFDAHYVHKLFGVFQRLHRAGEFAGRGVGLALARSIIARHGGRIWAHAAPHEGASFQFALPITGQ